MAPIVSFIIPLRSKKVSTDWLLISYLCCQTVNSCLNSQVKDTRVLIVGHERPEGLEKISDHRVRFIEAKHQSPDSSECSKGMNDKWAKVAQGLVELHADPPEYLMIVDADDLISSRLVTYIVETKPKHGLIINQGYICNLHSKRIKLVKESFNCGSNAVIRVDAIKLPSSLSETDLQQCIPLIAGHTIIEQRMRDEGKALAAVPFPAAIYLQHSGQHSKEGLLQRRHSPSSLLKNIIKSTVEQIYSAMGWNLRGNVLQKEFGFLREEQAS